MKTKLYFLISAKRVYSFARKPLSGLVVVLLLLPTIILAQGVAVNEDDSEADPSAMLDVQSADKGILIPKVQLDDKSTAAPVTNPSEGLLIYNETGSEAKGYWYWNGTEWVQMQTTTSSGSGLVGSILSYAGISVPTGYLLCDGSAVSRTTYANLFAALGTSWGEGDGSTTFNLPDLRGRFMRGVDNGAGNDPDAGSRSAQSSGGNTGDNVGTYQSHSLQSFNIGNGSHQLAFSYSRTSNDPTNGYVYQQTTVMSGGYNVAFGSTSSVVPKDANFSMETRPINVNVYYIIQY